jgi:hypothetical protein
LLSLSGSVVPGLVLGAPERRRAMLRVACVALDLLVVLTRRRLATSRLGRRSTTACREGRGAGGGSGRQGHAGFTQKARYRHACIAEGLHRVMAIVWQRCRLEGDCLTKCCPPWMQGWLFFRLCVRGGSPGRQGRADHAIKLHGHSFAELQRLKRCEGESGCACCLQALRAVCSGNY